MKKVCGLDVHKDNVFVCILSENGEKIQEKYGILTPDLDRLRDLLVSQGVGKVCMESTATYWMPIWRVLESDFELYLVNPYAIKQLPGRKSDVKDAEWIATCLMKDLIRGSYVPDLIIQQMRQYNRRIYDINNQSVRIESKMDALLQRCGIRLSNYVSNVDTKGYQEVVKKVIEGVTDAEELLKKVHGRTINKWGRDTLKASLTGVVTDVDRDILRQYKEELDQLKRHKEECQAKLTAMCKEHFPTQLANLQTMPGVDENSATQVMAEVGVDLRLFITAAMLVGWAGLKPRNDESNGKFKSKKTTHGNKYLRKLLIECAWGASRTKGCFYNKFSYHQTQVRKKKGKKVQVAIARKMLVAIWFILTTGCQYKDYVREVEQKTEEARDIAREAVRKAIKPKAGKKERQDAGQQPQS